MKTATYLLSALLLAAAVYADDTAVSEQNADLKIVKIVKKNSGLRPWKNLPGPANLAKDDKAYMKMVMDAQPHLKPKITHTKKGDSHEK